MKSLTHGLYLFPLLGVIAIITGVVYLISGQTAMQPHEDQAVELLIFCDTDLRPLIQGAGLEHGGGLLDYFQRRAGVRVKARYSTAEELQRQLLAGGGGDLVFAADEAYMEAARRAVGLMQIQTVAWRRPVLLVPGGNPHGIATITELADSGLRLVVAGRPGAPLSRLVQQVLADHGEGMEDMFKLEHTGAAAAAGAVEAGRAAAAVMWQSEAFHPHRNVEFAGDTPVSRLTSPVNLAILSTAAQPEAASRFSAFVTSRTGREILARYGYLVNPE